MNAAIVGSRRRNSLDDEAQVRRVIDQLLMQDATLVIVSGGCPEGADHFAEAYADERCIPKLIFLPTCCKCQIRRHTCTCQPKQRYQFAQENYARNVEVVEASEWIYAQVADDRKGGTEHTIGEAHVRGRPVTLLNSDNTEKLVHAPMKKLFSAPKARTPWTKT